MDGLSRLIRLARLRGSIDVRCLVAGQFALDRDAAPPGDVPFHLVLDGRCTVSTAAGAVELRPGHLLLLPRGDAHQVRAASGPALPVELDPGPAFATRRSVGAEPELDLFCGHFHVDSAAGALLFRLLPPLVHVALEHPAAALAEILRGEARCPGPGTSAIIGSLCDALLTMALRSHPGRRLGTPALWTAMGDDELGEVISRVVARPGEPWTIERMAAAAAMSRATFVRRLAARTGSTAATLLTTVRVMVAADLLTHSDHSVARIATEVGYRSESAFARAFRAATGSAPARFRKDTTARAQPDG
jgi:AraC family transcriptional regulator, activator of mtrCDE